MMCRLRAVATAVATTLVVFVDGVSADPENASHVDEMTAVVDSEGITVSGRATFVDVPGIVGEDAKNDAVGTAAPLGHELTAATISRPGPFADTLRFVIGVANQQPEVNGVPELVVYRWDFTITTDGEKQRDVTLLAWRSSLRNNTLDRDPNRRTDPFFQLYTCESDGDCRFFGVTGSMGDGLVAWNVRQPLGEIAQVGSVITSEDGIKVMSSASGLLSSPTGLLGGVTEEGVVLDEVPTDTAYTVPGPAVRIGIAPVGTAPQDVSLMAAETVDSQGAFSGRLPTPATPGEYTIVARACYGTNSCGMAAANVTVL